MRRRIKKIKNRREEIREGEEKTKNMKRGEGRWQLLIADWLDSRIKNILSFPGYKTGKIKGRGRPNNNSKNNTLS